MCNHTADTQTSSVGKTARAPFERLPTTVVPTNYSLHLMPDLGHFLVDGVVDIALSVRAPDVTVLKLNAAELAVHSAVLRVSSAAGVVAAVSIETNEETQLLTLTFPSALPLTTGPDAPKVTLSIAYTGYINDKLCGLYRSSYTAADGSQQVMACSQFEAVDARRCLPCWDEPAVKATFDVTITAPKHLTPVSNMPVVESVPFAFAADKDAAAAAVAAGADVWETNASSPATTAFFAARFPGVAIDYSPKQSAKKDGSEPVIRTARCDNPALLSAVVAGDAAAAATARGFNGSVAANSELVTSRFSRSPIMSTYLLTFVLGEFDVLEREVASAAVEADPEEPGTTHFSASTVMVRVLTMPGTGPQVRSRSFHLFMPYHHVISSMLSKAH